MSLGGLPPELVNEICSHCDVAELKALKLTSRILSWSADNWLYREIVLYMTRESLEYVRKVAETPRLARTVRVLWVQGDFAEDLYFDKFVEELREQAQWAREAAADVYLFYLELAALDCESEPLAAGELERRQKEIRKRMEDAVAAQPEPMMSNFYLHNGHDYHAELAREAYKMQMDSTIYRALRPLFRNCPNLSEIDYSLAHAGRTTTTKLNKQFRRGLLAPISQPYDSAIHGLGGMEQIVLAAADAGYQPKVLNLGEVTNYLLTSPALSEGLPLFAQKLEVLDWMFCTVWDKEQELEPDLDELDNQAEDFYANGLSSFLRHASNLRELTLSFPVTINKDSTMPPTWTALFGNTKWLHLTKFHVTCVSTTLEELLDFFLRHAGVLEDICLDDMCMEEGSWQEFFPRIAGKLEKLTNFELLGKFYNEDLSIWHFFGYDEVDTSACPGFAISDYVMSGGPNIPDFLKVEVRHDHDWDSEDGDSEDWEHKG